MNTLNPKISVFLKRGSWRLIFHLFQKVRKYFDVREGGTLWTLLPTENRHSLTVIHCFLFFCISSLSLISSVTASSCSFYVSFSLSLSLLISPSVPISLIPSVSLSHLPLSPNLSTFSASNSQPTDCPLPLASVFLIIFYFESFPPRRKSWKEAGKESRGKYRTWKDAKYLLL